MIRPVSRSTLERPSTEVAPDLLNKLISATTPGGATVSGRIVEVEAYGGADDEASHAFRGPTRRNAAMFGRAGTLYVYFTYGMHFCANVVTGEVGLGEAVLVRALAPVEGLEEMQARRPRAVRDRDLCNGPAKLCQSLAIDRSDDRLDLLDADSRVRLLDDGVPPPAEPLRSVRIGISRAVDRPWRLSVPGDPNLSRAVVGA